MAEFMEMERWNVAKSSKWDCRMAVERNFFHCCRHRPTIRSKFEVTLGMSVKPFKKMRLKLEKKS
jgi:hypothetical protein